MVDHFGLDVVLAYMKHVQDNAEETVRRVIQNLSDGEYEYEMDFGARDPVAITVHPETRSATAILPARRRSRTTTSTSPTRSRSRRCCIHSG